MPFLLVEGAELVCDHGGATRIGRAGQSLVTIEGQPVLVEDDTEGKPIKGCPNLGATIKPCMITLLETGGASELIRIEVTRVCLKTVTGLTDGTPPGLVEYRVRRAGQDFVSEES